MSNQAPEKPAAFVLGYGAKGEVMNKQFADRLDAAAEALKSGEVSCIFLYCAVETRPSRHSRAIAMGNVGKDYLHTKHDLAANDVWAFPSAYTTYGELAVFRKEIGRHLRGVPPIIFTSKYHIPRARYLAKGLGLTAKWQGVNSGTMLDKFLEPIKFIKSIVLPSVCSAWRK